MLCVSGWIKVVQTLALIFWFVVYVSMLCVSVWVKVVQTFMTLALIFWFFGTLCMLFYVFHRNFEDDKRLVCSAAILVFGAGNLATDISHQHKCVRIRLLVDAFLVSNDTQQYI